MKLPDQQIQIVDRPDVQETTGKRYPVSGLVMSPDTALALFNQPNKIVGTLEQQGLVKRDQVIVTPSGKLN